MANNQISSMDPIISLYRNSKQNINIPINLQCSKCHLLIIKPVQTECGCRYCQDCLDEYLSSDGRTCLGDFEDCKNVIKGYIFDKATWRDINGLILPCINEPCVEKSPLRSIKEHFQTCQYRTVCCERCQLVFLWSNQQKHDNEECVMRLSECPHCNLSMPHKELTELHLNISSDKLCVKYCAPCPNQCGVNGDVILAVHLRTCENRPQQCPFHLLGCDKFLSREAMPEHVISHTYTIVQEVEALKNEMTKMKEKIEIERGVTQTQIEAMKSDFNAKLALMERNQKEAKLRSGDKIETIYNRGKYIWKIPNFSIAKENARNGSNLALISGPFYTDEFGYKMCMKIYPNGDGIAKGTYLSVFFVLMKGEYDDLQSWPFRNKVTLTVIDEFSKTSNHSDTFKPDATSICYKKPVDEFNIASGSPKFLLFSELNRFLKGDTLYLQITVHPL